MAKQNGELIELMVKDNFDILITFDQNLQHQQNFKKYPIKVITLSAVSNTYANLRRLLPSIKNELNKRLKPEVVNIKL